MNMNKTILATLITIAFSSNVIAQSVDTGSHTEQSGVAYEQDDSSAWKAVGGGALALTAAVLSGSSSSSSNGSSEVPENLPSPDIDPDFGQKPGIADITEVAGVKLVIGDEGNIVVVGDNYAYLGDASGDYKGKGFTIENDRKLVDSQGNVVATFKVHQDGTVTINRLSTDGQEITETVKVVNIDGRLAIISHDWTIGGGEVNPEKDRPVIDHPEHLPVDGIHLVGNNLYKDGTKLGYVTTDTKKLVVNGEEVADVKTFNNLDNMFAVKGSLDDVQYTVYVTETGEVRFMKQSEFHAVVKDSIKDRITTDPDFGQGERLKNIDRSKLQNIKTQVMNRLAK